MDVLSEQLHGSARKKVLRRRVHQVGVRIVVRERRVDVGERQDDGKQREDDDVDLLAEEHTENGPPVGVPRGRDLFGFQIAVADRGEKLFVGQDGLRIGLRDYDGNPKPAYYVWKAADTENESSVLDSYLGTLGLENWNGIIHNVMSTGVSTLKTGSRSLEVCSVQGGIKVRASGAGQLCTIYEITGTAVVSQKVKGCRFIALPRGVYIVNGRKVAVR